MEKRHVNAKFDCYQLLKILEEIVIKEGIKLQDVMVGISIQCDEFDITTAIAHSISLCSDGNGHYVLVLSNK